MRRMLEKLARRGGFAALAVSTALVGSILVPTAAAAATVPDKSGMTAVVSTVDKANPVITAGTPSSITTAPTATKSNNVTAEEPPYATPIAAAIGDSYATAYGNPNTDGCGRGPDSPLGIIADYGIINLHQDLACAGSTTTEALAQAALIDSNVTDVYVMVGGNDIGFGPGVYCVYYLNCPPAVLQAILDRAKSPTLTANIKAVVNKARCPQAEVANEENCASSPNWHNSDVILGFYPDVFPRAGRFVGDGCSSWLNDEELSYAQQIQVALNTAIGNAARQVNADPAGPRISLANPDGKMRGHDICATENSYFHQPEHPGAFHLNIDGLREEAKTIVATRHWPKLPSMPASFKTKTSTAGQTKVSSPSILASAQIGYGLLPARQAGFVAADGDIVFAD